ncbi:uncharacterized protein B0H64DRAFT_357766 [Chaetomium fimeti]|uniref:Uncharacterized protein n=1 Tax=Chaetomium fimeti TaxID=1854472 RepID=A0AAE0HJI4_9PEZI|nr:hypothetical protein B0H64DRAFT_357766 [Chaetomium fimeti]
MATTLRPRPCVELDIHDDHSHKDTPCDTTTSALGELPLNNIQNVRRRTSIESLARRLDNLHINNSDKENVSRPVVEAAPRVSSAAPNTKDTPCDKSHTEGRRPRGDSHDDAELRRGEKTLYFGCNLVNRGSQCGAAPEGGKSTNVYTLLATRIKAEEEFIVAGAPVFDTMEVAAADQLRLGDASMTGRHYEHLDVPKSPGLIVEVNEIGADLDGDRSRPLSRIEDSVEALDQLEDEIEALTQVARLERMLSPEGATPQFKAASAQSTPLKRATSVRAPASARSKTVERSASVRKPTSTGDGEQATASSARKVARPTSLLPPKPLAKSSRAPTTSTFELPGEAAVARRLKEQREQRMSQQISPEQAAALAAAYSPSKPHFKSAKPPTQSTFELPGEAISRKKREAREAKLRAQEEEERKRREFKARPIRGSLVPNSVPRETLASLARLKTRGTDSSADSGTTTVTPVAKKRQSTLFASSSTSANTRPSKTNTTTTTTTPTSATTSATLPTRGRNPEPHLSTGTTSTTTSLTRAASTSTASVHSRSSKVSAGEAAQQKLRGKEVFARDNSYAADREREKKERERAAREAREQAAERSRELSRLWAEKQRVKREGEERRRRMVREEGGVEEVGVGAVGVEGVAGRG